MSKAQLRGALLRAIVLEHRNGDVTPFPRWGWERPISMFVLRNRRRRVAFEYAKRYEPVSALLFERRLPRGNDWPGTRLLVPAPIFAWVDDVWTQIACSVPIRHRWSDARGA